MNRKDCIIKELHEAGQQQADTGYRLSYPRQSNEVINADIAREQTNPLTATTGQTLSPNRPATEQEQNGDSSFFHESMLVIEKLPPDLISVIAAWPHLSESMKAGITAMVAAASTIE